MVQRDPQSLGRLDTVSIPGQDPTLWQVGLRWKLCLDLIPGSGIPYVTERPEKKKGGVINQTL